MEGRRAEKALFWLAVALAVLGAVSVLALGPKAKTGLYSGLGVGALAGLWGWLMGRGVPWALPLALGNVGFGALAFGWRAFVSWLAFADGKADRLGPAIITTFMCAACAAVFPLLIRRWQEEESAAR